MAYPKNAAQAALQQRFRSGAEQMDERRIKRDPRMSVIIPVYNKSPSLEDLIASLASQSAPAGSFEAIFIDDGSTDDSLAKCRAAEAVYPFVRVIAQENGGVSSARNTGIAHSTGDYIMFVDADDSISSEAIENLVATFDKIGEEADVVGYRMLYIYPATGQETYHASEQWLKRTGLYCLDEVPFIAQSTMNVCIRNRREDNILFDTSLTMGEDQMFITQNLRRKATYGFCREAEYRYIRDGSTASSLSNHPFYAFDDMMRLFEELVAIAKSEPLMRRYACNLILHNVEWRMKSDMLFPTHLEGDDRKAADDRLAAVMSSIPHEAYVSCPYLSPYQKAFLLERYAHPGQDLKPFHSWNHSAVLFGDGSIWRTRNASVAFERCLFHDGVLRMRGRLLCPTFRFEGKPRLSVIVGKKRRKLELSRSSYGYASAKFPITNAWSFSCDLDLSGKTGQLKIRFEGSIGEFSLHPSISFAPRMHNARVINKVYHYPHLTLKSKDGVLDLSLRKARYPKKYYLRVDRERREASSARFRCEMFIKRTAGKRLWLYVDLPTSEAEGNALAMMLHDVEQEDGIERYYISDHADALVAKYPVLRKKVVALDSNLHKHLSLRSEVIVHSYLESFTYSPFTKEEFGALGDFAIKQMRVYVQHGILHAHMPWYFSFDRLATDKEVVSTTMERNALLETYGFPEDAILASGAPRLDRLTYSSAGRAKKILYAPSWRSYLVAGNAKDRLAVDHALLASSFYQGMSAFIALIVDSGLCERYGCKLELKLHPNFKCYEHLFDFGDGPVSLASDVIDECDYSVVVTDLSSYVYDFVYTGARIVYFLPDHVEFKAGLNHYSQLELPFSEGFGPYCETPEETLEALEAILAGTDTLSEEYERRRSDFFFHTDGNNCNRLYAELKACADAL